MGNRLVTGSRGSRIDVIHHSAWFLKICELRQAAARLAGADQFDTLHTTFIDYLNDESVSLLRRCHFYNYHPLHAEWHSLEDLIECPYNSYHTSYVLNKIE